MALLRPYPAILALLFLPLAMPAIVAGEEHAEYEIKAAFLLNFARFVDWPDRTLAPGDPFVIGIFGEDPLAEALEQLVKNQSVIGRRMVVHRISELSALRSCQIVFVPDSEARRGAEISRAIAGASVLTVGEVEGYAEKNSIVNFVMRDNHVRFEINPSAAARAHLKISSKLLQLAIIIGPKP